MTLSNRTDISIVELVFFTPALLFSVFLCVRHGFGPNKGWLFLLIFSLIRLAGASLELATIGFPTNIPLQTSAVLLSSVGLSPLMFITLGLLFRVCKSINKNCHTIFQRIHIRLLRIPIIIAIVLVIIGSDASASDLTKHGTYPIKPMSKIGIILLVAVFAVIVLITTEFMIRRSYAEPAEQRLIHAVAASLPFLVIRLVYVLLVFFSHIRTFSILNGSLVAFGCMSLMQEMLVVIIYIGVGVILPRKNKGALTDGEQVVKGPNDTVR